MTTYTRQQLFDLSHQLGHTDPAMWQTESGRRWFMTCGCGWQSTTKVSEVEALKAGTHHALKAAREYLSSHRTAGVSLPGSVGPRL